MRSFARIVLIAFLCLAAAHTRAAADDSARLVGVWHEYSPSDNLVNFFADGTIVMYLRKGEIGDLHTLDGKWTLSQDGMLTVTFATRGKSVTQTNRMTFVGDEMIITDDKGAQTKHRRYTGPLPDWTQW